MITKDMVWLVAQEVSLADGTVQKVLAPQVYGKGSMNPQQRLHIVYGFPRRRVSQYAAQPCVRLEAVRFCRLDQRTDDGARIGAGRRVAEHPRSAASRPANRHRRQRRGDLSIPSGIVRANPTLGPGGATQYFIRDYNSQLRLLDTIDLEH